MSKEKPKSAGHHTSVNKSTWISEAGKYPQYLPMVKELLDRGMGRSLNGQQLHVETCAILACLLQETGMFAEMADMEIRKMIINFLQIYWGIRDEEKYPGINHAESTSGRFEKDFLVIAISTFNRIMRRSLRYPDPNAYFKVSKQ
ncbi:MAG: hypothetical protein Q7S11_01405 [bacterium]|nr:hypothetical protein [bacterium]